METNLNLKEEKIPVFPIILGSGIPNLATSEFHVTKNVHASGEYPSIEGCICTIQECKKFNLKR